MSDHYPFDVHFQRILIALVFRRRGFLRQFREVLAPARFSKIVHGVIMEVTNDLHDRFGSATPEMVLQEIRRLAGSPSLRSIDPTVYEREVRRIESLDCGDEADYTRELLVAFARRQALAAFVQRAADTAEQGPTSEDYDRMGREYDRIIQIGHDITDTGTWFFRDAREWLRRHERVREGRVLTMIRRLDEKTHGLGAGEVGVILGFKGRGKTATLVNLSAAAIFQRKRIVYYTVGDQEETYINARLAARVSGSPANEISDHEGQLLRKLEEVHSMFRGDFVCKFFVPGTTVRQLDAHLTTLEGLGYVPDMVVVDYGDQLAPGRSRGSGWEDQQAAYNELIALAGERRVALWTASQIGRSQGDKAVVGLEDAAYSFAKLAGVHLVLSLSQLPEERRRDQMRIVVAHQRHGPAGGAVLVDYDWDRMLVQAAREGNEDVTG